MMVVTGCMARPADLRPGDEDEDLMDALGPRVMLLAAPQDSLAGVLGAVIDPATGAPMLTRRMVVPASTRSTDLVTFTGLRAMTVASGVAIDPFGGIDDAEATHVSYDVTVWDSYYLVGEQPYETGSDCCSPDGAIDPSCRAGYVTRAFVGSGTLRYVSDSATSVGGGAGPLEIHGSRSYRVLRERHFTSAVFAVEVAPALAVCEQAFCAEREESGACGMCRVEGRQAEIASMTAPADGALSVLCEHMRAGAEASITLRGDVTVEDCLYDPPSATVAIVVDGAQIDRFELSSSEGASGPLTFSRRTEAVRADAGGVLFAALDLVECRCGEASARCQLDEDLTLSIDATR